VSPAGFSPAALNCAISQATVSVSPRWQGRGLIGVEDASADVGGNAHRAEGGIGAASAMAGVASVRAQNSGTVRAHGKGP
jgi:hypothetical protein